MPLSPLLYKPDLEEAAKRWDAYYASDIIDRPLVCVTAPKPGFPTERGAGYHERVFGDLRDIVRRALVNAEATYYAGEAMPVMGLSFGPDEMAVFCGGKFEWSDDSGDTNWSIPYVDDWNQAFPIQIDDNGAMWKRMIEFYEIAAEMTEGKMLLSEPDLHSNMDLLSAMRSPQELSMDLIDCPELIDRAMMDARAMFKKWWDTFTAAGKHYERGFYGSSYGPYGAATLQCDYCCMISPDMFRRWVLPALIEEAEIVKRVVYHWDGPGALVHTDDLVAAKGLHTLSYVPGTGHGNHLAYVDMFRSLQDRGKGIQFWGSPDEIKEAHKVLRPEKTLYETWTQTPAEADELLEWMAKNT